MNIVIQCNTFPAGGAVSTLLNASQLTADMNLRVLFETTQCCFKSSLMEFYKQVLVEICISKSAFNGLYVQAWYELTNYRYQKSDLRFGFSKSASAFQFPVPA